MLDEERGHYFASVRIDLEALGAPHAVDKALIRGLDYNRRLVFKLATSLDLFDEYWQDFCRIIFLRGAYDMFLVNDVARGGGGS